MKPGAPPEVTPLADKLQRQPPGAAARGWMSTTPVAAPAPLFSGGYTAPIIDHADIERRVAEGLARAREEGERQGWAKAEEDVAAAIARLGNALSQVQATAREMLAFIIARGLVGAEVKRDPAPLVRLIERCLDEVTGESSITLRLHPADRAILMVLRPELALTDLRILEDESIARGGCAVESARRLVDARVEERLDNVRDGVRQLLEEADLADG
jgi:flagellar biosynthesis/type III secretory pathway protein FliH